MATQPHRHYPAHPAAPMSQANGDLVMRTVQSAGITKLSPSLLVRPMRTALCLLAASLGLVCFDAAAQKTQSHDLCTTNQVPVFSCTLQGKVRKIVSLCASTASAQGKRSFRYRYGRPSKIELEYPTSGDGNDVFTQTHLLYAGGTTGNAYAFSNDGFKYILYWVAGAGFERSGLLVQHAGQSNADRDRHCNPSTAMPTSNHELWDATSKWKVDQDLSDHGLPMTQ